jgi:hypothetical protein
MLFAPETIANRAFTSLFYVLSHTASADSVPTDQHRPAVLLSYLHYMFENPADVQKPLYEELVRHFTSFLNQKDREEKVRLSPSPLGLQLAMHNCRSLH